MLACRVPCAEGYVSLSATLPEPPGREPDRARPGGRGPGGLEDHGRASLTAPSQLTLHVDAEAFLRFVADEPEAV